RLSGEVDVEAILAAEAKAKADTRNITFLAFTATPKAKTMEMFGTLGEDGLPHPFHTYTMAQAIEEKFILDVLLNYTTYDTAFELAKKVEGGQMQPVRRIEADGELVDESAATKGLMRWVKLHPTNIAQKVQVIIEHFESNVKPLLGGRAKAMVVTDSRKAAVRYKTAMDAYIAKMGYSDYTSLVAFSGEVDDPETGPGPFTEHSMNPGVKDLRTAFNTDEYRVMIVANKFQTGFDQPLLCAMYVDRQLSGVTAVQTLSRLNRFVPSKKTMILDFVNDEEEILAAFKPYYEEAQIVATTDPNQIHDLQTKLDTSGRYTPEELDAVVEAFVLNKGNNALAGAIQPVKQRFIAAYNTAVAKEDKGSIDELDTFRKDVGTYVRLYDFLSQIIDFGDTDVEKHAIFLRLLAPHLRASGGSDRVDLSDVELVHIKQKETGTHTLDLAEGEVVPLKPTTGAGSKASRDPRMVLLDELIDRLNSQFAGEDFRDDQVSSWTNALVDAMKTDEDLREQAEVNSEEQFLASPTLKDALLLAVAETNDAHSRMTELFNEKGAVEKAMIELLGKLLYLDLHGAQEPARLDARQPRA
ncbi:type I restriction endonuclease subunit R, partial [Sinomonas humi]|uniref:type I restriction endonuclease subunit R n=1 Tax=Sinomonas humi TaxID=1338436 RepID=UPI0018CD3D6F